MLPSLSQIQHGPPEQSRASVSRVVSAFITADRRIEADIVLFVAYVQAPGHQNFDNDAAHLASGGFLSSGTVPSAMSFDTFLFDDSLREWTTFDFAVEQ